MVLAIISVVALIALGVYVYNTRTKDAVPNSGALPQSPPGNTKQR